MKSHEFQILNILITNDLIQSWWPKGEDQLYARGAELKFNHNRNAG